MAAYTNIAGKPAESFIYRGYGIDFNFYGRGEYTIQYCGDDIEVETETAARELIDSIILQEG